MIIGADMYSKKIDTCDQYSVGALGTYLCSTHAHGFKNLA